MGKSHKVTLMPQGESFQVLPEQNLLAALKEQGTFLKSSCGGCASCSDCTIQILTGEEFLSEISFEEKRLLGNTFHITKERLACQLKVKGDVKIDVSNHLTYIQEKKINNTPKITRRKAQEKVEPERREKKIKESGFKKPKAFKYSDK